MIWRIARSSVATTLKSGPNSPNDGAVAGNDREQARLPAADDDVVRREALVAFVVPVVRTDIGRRVRVHPVEARRARHSTPAAGAGSLRGHRRRNGTHRCDRWPAHCQRIFPSQETSIRRSSSSIASATSGCIVVRVGQHQRLAARETRAWPRASSSRREILTLPVVVLAQRPDRLAVAGLDLLVVVEMPERPCRRNRAAPARAIPGAAGRRPAAPTTDAAGKHACRTAGGIVVAVPSLDDVAVHVDDDHGLSAERRQHRVAVPGPVRIVDRRAGWIDGRRSGGRDGHRQQHQGGQRSKEDGHEALH